MLSESKKTLKIAIVDDEKELLNVFTLILERLGYSTPDVFNDGTSFIKSLTRDKQSYDVILMDYRMPEMDGIETAKIVKNRKPETQIIMITGYDFVKEKAHEIGILYLQKPFTAKQLSECINNLKLGSPSPSSS